MTTMENNLKYTRLVQDLTTQLLNKKIENRFVNILYNTFRQFKGVKNIDLQTRLYYIGTEDCKSCGSCSYFQVHTTLRNEYILNDLFEKHTNLKCSKKNLITKEVIEEASKITLEHMDTLNGLYIHREQGVITELFYPFIDKQRNYLVEDIENAELKNEPCCVCYNRTSTKIYCCNASVCKVCLIEIAHTKIQEKIDYEVGDIETKVKNKLVCPHCRKDHNDYRDDELIWAIKGEKIEEDEEDEEDE